ncbi:MAG: hypothetical protein IPL99_11275, partial [Candidatus Competibacteraceae bacterium]|nr:hypothetical protein [Candidatus Competibacteraceae bacterium]
MLVRSHRQGRLIRDHLLRLRVPSVQHADDSVLTTAEAQHLEWVLAAVAEPGDEGRVRAALASDPGRDERRGVVSGCAMMNRLGRGNWKPSRIIGGCGTSTASCAFSHLVDGCSGCA